VVSSSAYPISNILTTRGRWARWEIQHTLTFDLKHFQRVACDMVKLRTKFERTRAIRGELLRF